MQGLQVLLAELWILRIITGVGQTYGDKTSLVSPEGGAVDARHTTWHRGIQPAVFCEEGRSFMPRPLHGLSLEKPWGYYPSSSSSPGSQYCQLSYAFISQAADDEKTLAILGPTRATITEPNKMCLPSSLT